MEERYYQTKESVQEYIRLAKDVNGKELIAKMRLSLPDRSSLVEIGSGPGTDFEILNQYYKVIGSDNSEEFLKHLKTKFPKEQFLNLEASTLQTSIVVDGIYSNKVLHHLTDDQLKKSIKKQTKLLNNKGIICHSFWNGEGTEIFKGLYVNYHNEQNLKELFEEDFNIISIALYKEFEENDSLLLIASKK